MSARALTFRLATLDDVPAIVPLVESAYRGEASLAGWTSEAHLLGGQRVDAEMVADSVAGEGSRMILAFDAEGNTDGAGDDGTLLACCELKEKPDAVYFGMFAVVPTLQGGGVGRQVLAEAERLAHDDLGATLMEMTVLEQREALVDWYLRRGYTNTGERRPFPYGDSRFGDPKVDDLRMVVLTKALPAG